MKKGTIATATVLDIDREVELLERCASECLVIAELATDECARAENEVLASEYRQIAEALSFRRKAA